MENALNFVSTYKKCMNSERKSNVESDCSISSWGVGCGFVVKDCKGDAVLAGVCSVMVPLTLTNEYNCIRFLKYMKGKTTN